MAITFEDFNKIDIRVGKILKVEDFLEARNPSYKLEIDLGKEIGKRTLAAGLKPYYKPAELKGKTCIIFTNLQPRMLKGVESQGMLLAAVSPDGKHVHLLQPDSDIELGSKVR